MPPLTVVLESGLAGSPAAWLPVAKLLDSDFHVVIHRRGGKRNLLPEIAEDLRAALHRAGIPPPFLLVGHSFGALVIRQFAAAYPEDTALLLFVDGLPASTTMAPADLARGMAVARLAQLLASLSAMGPLLRLFEHRIRQVEWAFQELRKLPGPYRRDVFAEWLTPNFYRDLSLALSALPENLRIARSLEVHAPSRSLHSDYPDPTGERVENAGHWIQIDRPELVADAVRNLAHALL